MGRGHGVGNGAFLYGILLGGIEVTEGRKGEGQLSLAWLPWEDGVCLKGMGTSKLRKDGKMDERELRKMGFCVIQ